MANDTVNVDTAAVHRAIEEVIEYLADMLAIHEGAPDRTEALKIHLAGETFSVQAFHAGVEARIEQLQSENADLTGERLALRQEVEHLTKRVEAAMAAAEAAIEIQARRPLKSIDLERDATGAVVRAHVFENV